MKTNSAEPLELNLLEVEPHARHDLVFIAFDNLQPGETFQIKNDHDPVPLYHQMMHHSRGHLGWKYLQRDPGNFRVEISKPRY